jgi:hypothetical protein
MTRITRSILTLIVVCAVLLAGTAAPVSAAPTDTTDRGGEARTVLATPGPPGDRGGDHTTDVSGEIVLGEDRETATPTVRGTIIITVQVPENARGNHFNGKRIVREVGNKS